MELIFDNVECSVINFTDITRYKKLKQQEEINNLLKTLNASVHHEMAVPLKVNVELSQRLVQCLVDQPQLQNYAETVHHSSALVLLHCQDFMDQQLIEKGVFQPYLTEENLEAVIKETISFVRLMLEEKGLKIVCKLKSIKSILVLKFDKRRLQQVLLNLLNNAIKFQRHGQIKLSAKVVVQTI